MVEEPVTSCRSCPFCTVLRAKGRKSKLLVMGKENERERRGRAAWSFGKRVYDGEEMARAQLREIYTESAEWIIK